jgi:hypothetical protein
MHLPRHLWQSLWRQQVAVMCGQVHLSDHEITAMQAQALHNV